MAKSRLIFELKPTTDKDLLEVTLALIKACLKAKKELNFAFTKKAVEIPQFELIRIIGFIGK